MVENASELIQQRIEKIMTRTNLGFNALKYGNDLVAATTTTTTLTNTNVTNETETSKADESIEVIEVNDENGEKSKTNLSNEMTLFSAENDVTHK